MIAKPVIVTPVIATPVIATPGAGRETRAGFALLAVVWGLALISTMVVASMSASRLRLQKAHNIARAAQAAFITESAIHLAIPALLSGRDAPVANPGKQPPGDGTPQFCVLDGAAVALAIEEEGGKIDINAAAPELIANLLKGLGADDRTASVISKAVVAYRSAEEDPLRANRSAAFLGQGALFQTVFELDQIEGMTPGLFQALLPFVTVHSRSAGVDPRTAAPALFAALSGGTPEETRRLATHPFPNGLNRNDPRFPPGVAQSSDRGAYLVHAEALLATGQTAVRDAVIDLRPTNGRSFALRELRRGRSIYPDRLRDIIRTNGAGAENC